MSPAMLAWSAAWTLVAVAAGVRLLRASSQPEPFVKNGYRWLAVAAICLGAGGTVQQAFGGLIGGALPLRIADLISLAALPALVIGLATLTSQFAAWESDPPGAERLLRESEGVMPAAPPRGIAVDSCLLVASLFVICLVTLFWPDYVSANVGRAAFALMLIRPLADLVALGLLLRFAVRSLRVTLLPMLALVAVTIGDSLAVGDRVAGVVAGPGAGVALLLALALLALAPATPAWAALTGLLGLRSGSRLPGPGRPRDSWSSPATIAALVATGVAAVVVTGFSVGGSRITTPALAIADSIVVLLLVARLAGLARQASAVAASAQESDWMFRVLADTTSDTVMICDLVGTIEYVSQAVAEFGYSPGRLVGKRLADLVHPEDRPAGIRAAITGLRAVAGTASFAGRIRGADGSWRYVESTLSRYGAAGEPARLLITSRDVSDRVALRRQLTQLTFHDGLTGLPNRAYVEERIKDLARGPDGQPGDGPTGDGPPADGQYPLVAAIIVDFDGYAAVNDLVGQTGGDLVLAQAARRLRAAVPPPATVARWGGDEFAILIGAAATAQEVIDLAERLAGQIAAEPFSVAAREIMLTVSIGVAMSGAASADRLLGNASIALSRAQEAGIGRVEVFAAQMHADARRRVELAGELAQAIAEHRLEIVYQPVVEFATSRVRDVAAIVRWSRAGEVIPPDVLRGVAEDSGLVGQIRDWLLGEACRQVAAWRAQGWAIGLSVHCTLAQVSGARLVGSVLAALDEADLPPQSLTLEVTERELIGAAASMAADLAGLRGKGIRLAIDSFGTGYASLAFLRQLAVDVIKIDSSFVAGLGTDPTLALLTRSIVKLAHDLGVEVIAEGIESDEQRAELEAMGCELGQGSAITGPMPTCQAGDTACTTAS